MCLWDYLRADDVLETINRGLIHHFTALELNNSDFLQRQLNLLPDEH